MRIGSLLLPITVAVALAFSSCGGTDASSGAPENPFAEAETEAPAAPTFSHEIDGCTFSTCTDINEFITDDVLDFSAYAEHFGLEVDQEDSDSRLSASSVSGPYLRIYLERFEGTGRYDNLTVELEEASFIDVAYTGKYADAVQLGSEHSITYGLLEVMTYAIECAQQDQATAAGAVRTMNLPTSFDVYVEPEDGPVPNAPTNDDVDSGDSATTEEFISDGYHHKVGNATFTTEHDLESYRKHIRYLDEGDEYECYDFEMMCADIWGVDEKGSSFSNNVGVSFYAVGSTAAEQPDKQVLLSHQSGSVVDEIQATYKVDDSLSWVTTIGMLDCPEPEEGYYLAGLGRKYVIHPDMAPLVLYVLEHMEVDPSNSGLSELDLGDGFYSF